MLSYIELENFKSFEKIRIDFRQSHGEPKKLIFIYGENGSGKSNITSSVLFLLQTLSTLAKSKKINEITENKNIGTNSKDRERLTHEIIRLSYLTLSALIEDYITIGSEKNMRLKFGFRINGQDGSYTMVFSKQGIVSEELRYKINERGGKTFSITESEIVLSPSIFTDIAYRRELRNTIKKYWGKHTFLAILTNELEEKNMSYIRSTINESLFEVIDWLQIMSVWCKEADCERGRLATPISFVQRLDKGTVSNEDDIELHACEKALNSLFTQLYSDIKAVYYKLSPSENEFKYELYFRKNINGHCLDIPISLESTGTKKLLNVFPLLLASASGATVVIDEIDSGIHDLLMKQLIESVSDSISGQFIATTHNTLLMEVLPPESTYIIRIQSEGRKSIECIADYEKRTQRTNNVRTKYLRGDYEGIPSIGYLDFDDIVREVITESWQNEKAQRDN